MSYEVLDAWKLCHQLVLDLYAATQAWPRSESYSLTSQVRRAGVSAASNIAEGVAKRGPREFRRYLDISLGSLSEVSYLLRLARDLHYLNDEAYGKLELIRTRASKCTWKLYASMRRPADRRADGLTDRRANDRRTDDRRSDGPGSPRTE
jgi:four helix bundle protein